MKRMTPERRVFLIVIILRRVKLDTMGQDTHMHHDHHNFKHDRISLVTAYRMWKSSAVIIHIWTSTSEMIRLRSVDGNLDDNFQALPCYVDHDQQDATMFEAVTLVMFLMSVSPSCENSNIFIDVFEGDVFNSFGQGEGVTVWLFSFIRYLR